jgi:hypothetical protein
MGYLPVPRGGEAVQLIVPHQRQTNNQLCWAACASMVCSFYGHVVRRRLSTQFNTNWGRSLNAMAAPGRSNLIED